MATFHNLISEKTLLELCFTHGHCLVQLYLEKTLIRNPPLVSYMVTWINQKPIEINLLKNLDNHLDQDLEYIILIVYSRVLPVIHKSLPDRHF